MTRIAHFTDATIGGVNGIASSIGLLVEALTRRGHDCTVVTSGPLWGAAGREPSRDDRVIWVPSVPTGMGDLRFAFLPLRAMRDRILAWRPDIAHVHTPGPLGAAGLTVARQMGIPAVYTYHTDMHGYAKYYYVPAPVIRAGTAVYGRHLKPATANRPVGRYEVIEAANARVFEAAKIIIAPTASALHRCRMTAYAHKVRVIATPAHLPPAGSTDAEFRTRFGIAADSPVLLFVGRLSGEKGIRLLLDAFSRVRARVPAATLLLVGPETADCACGVSSTGPGSARTRSSPGLWAVRRSRPPTGWVPCSRFRRPRTRRASCCTRPPWPAYPSSWWIGCCTAAIRWPVPCA